MVSDDSATPSPAPTSPLNCGLRIHPPPLHPQRSPRTPLGEVEVAYTMLPAFTRFPGSRNTPGLPVHKLSTRLAATSRRL